MTRTGKSGLTAKHQKTRLSRTGMEIHWIHSVNCCWSGHGVPTGQSIKLGGTLQILLERGYYFNLFIATKCILWCIQFFLCYSWNNNDNNSNDSFWFICFIVRWGSDTEYGIHVGRKWPENTYGLPVVYGLWSDIINRGIGKKKKSKYGG